jgi:hypothetical protein
MIGGVGWRGPACPADLAFADDSDHQSYSLLGLYALA